MPSLKTTRIKTLALLLAVPLMNGCSRKPEPVAPARVAPPPIASAPAASVTPSPVVHPPPPPTSESAAPATRPDPAVTYEVDAGLQRILIKFYNDNERPAMTWEDLLAGKYIPAIPRGPDGKPLDWNSTMQRIGRASDRSRK